MTLQPHSPRSFCYIIGSCFQNNLDCPGPVSIKRLVAGYDFVRKCNHAWATQNHHVDLVSTCRALARERLSAQAVWFLQLLRLTTNEACGLTMIFSNSAEQSS